MGLRTDIRELSQDDGNILAMDTEIGCPFKAPLSQSLGVPSVKSGQLSDRSKIVNVFPLPKLRLSTLGSTAPHDLVLSL